MKTELQGIVQQDTLQQDTLSRDSVCEGDILMTDEWAVPTVDSCLRASVYRGSLQWKETTEVRPFGEKGELFSEAYYRSDFYVLLLLAGLILLVGTWKRSYRFLRLLMLQFFFPLRQTPTSSQAEVSPPRPHIFLAVPFVMSVALLGFRWYDNGYYYLYSSVAQPYLLFLALCVGVSLFGGLCILLRIVVHNIFFSPGQRQMWRDSYKLVFCMEATLVFLANLIGLLLERTPEEVFLVVLGVVVLSKLVMLYKAKTIFFCGMYGYFHILLYLCALETAPLLILGKILMNLLEQSDMVIY